MGSIIEGMRTVALSQNSSKHKYLNLQEYIVKSQDSYAGRILKLQDGALGLFLVRQFSQSNYISVKSQLLKWIQSNSKLRCNVLNYDVKVQSLLCNSHITFKMIMQYGDKSLFDIIKQQSLSMSLDHSCISLSKDDLQISKPLQILKILKFMLDLLQEHSQEGKRLEFHNRNIIYFKKYDNFKYLNPPISERQHQKQTFFPPQRYTGYSGNSQQSTIFSMGMVLMSILLGEDCSDCYNYQHLTFCQSIFQTKLQKLNQICIQKGFYQALDQEASMYLPQFQVEISELIFSMTASTQQRISFQDLKKQYHRILKRLSLSYQVTNSQSVSRVILQPIVNKNGNRTSYKKVDTKSIHYSSTHQFLCGNSSENTGENYKKKVNKNINIIKVKIPKAVYNSKIPSRDKSAKNNREDKQNMNIQIID